MSTQITPYNTGKSTAPVADDDNTYKAVQAKLAKLADAMDSATAGLGHIHTSMRSNADQAHTLADHIANAGLDPMFVELTQQVAHALGGAATGIQKLTATAQDTATDAHDTQATHARLYGALDEVRSSSGRNRIKTPKPGFLVNHS